MSGGLIFRRFTTKDLQRISEFRKSYFPHNSSIRSHEPEYYEWKCYKNPFQQGEMWLAEDGNKIVAMKSITPKRMKILGNVINGAEMGDSFTRPDYQRRGIFTRLSKAARESIIDKGVSLIYNTPNKDISLPGYIKKVNHMLVPIELRALVKPLRVRQVLKARYHNPLLTFIASPVIEIIYTALFKIATIGIAKSDVTISRVSTFPADVDVLWEQASRSYDVLVVRKKEYLEWRYVTNPDAYQILIARNLNRNVSGYIVTKIGSSGDRQVGFIVDFLTIEDDPNIFKKLLTASLEEFYRRKVSVVSTWAIKGSFYNRIFLRFGFLPPRGGGIPFLCYKNDLGSRVLSTACKWHFTMGDTDNI